MVFLCCPLQHFYFFYFFTYSLQFCCHGFFFVALSRVFFSPFFFYNFGHGFFVALSRIFPFLQFCCQGFSFVALSRVFFLHSFTFFLQFYRFGFFFVALSRVGRKLWIFPQKMSSVSSPPHRQKIGETRSEIFHQIFSSHLTKRPRLRISQKFPAWNYMEYMPFLEGWFEIWNMWHISILQTH